jgi:BirA family biotin operon repressor/biotin-[acetyl-CoA-carboxylase] ligase
MSDAPILKSSADEHVPYLACNELGRRPKRKAMSKTDSVFGPPGNQFSREDLDRIVAETFVEHVEFHDAIASTNDRALELAGQYDGRFPLLVLTDKQTAGHGRGTNRWWAGRGALTFSLLLECEAAKLPPNRWPKVSLTAGLAVCEAIEELRVCQPVGLKWPNDVFLEGRKVSGILIEVPKNRRLSLVLGIGINVNNSWRDAPPELQTKTTALCDVAGRRIPPMEVLLRVLQRLADGLESIGTRDDELRARWRERCILTGRSVELEIGPRRIAGLCHGIDDDGALLVETDGRYERCYAGIVSQLGR